jgi:predicted AAA+ superfamily ATPase
MELQSRFFKDPPGSFFLFGPRGTGKTTWLRQIFPDALFLDLLQPDLARELAARPERLRDLVQAAPPDPSPIVIDEVQRVPELLNLVHALIEENKRRRFILTGSSARKLRRGGVDLLAGRAVVRTMHPFMARELREFHLVAALSQGMLPLVVAAENPKDVLHAYASLYLDQEVRLEGWTRNIGAFARFLEAISFSQAGVLNVANVARECQIERKTVVGYIEVLEDLLLSFRVPVFTRRSKREVSQHPKFFFFDVGVFRTLRPEGPLDRPEEIEGSALEGLVAQHLRAWLAYRNEDAKLFFWRTRSGVEVDFVVYGPGVFWAFEVKNAARVRPEDISGLKAFTEDYPQAECALLYRGTRRERRGRIWVLPVEPFLKQLDPNERIEFPSSARGSSS